jgi:hypothetical protein
MAKLVFILALPLLAAAVSAQDHGHLNVGASGAKLRWDNGPVFDPASGYVKTLTFTNAGKYAAFYQGNITLTAMHARNPFGEIDPNAPKPGSFIEAEIVSVQGPEGGAFAFWDVTSTAGNPTVSIPAGTTNAGFRFALSEASLGAGEPDGDPYGHIHGRRFTVTKPGLYTVGFRAHDTSSNGADGGPIHTSSDIQLIQFQGGVVLARLEQSETTITITLGAMAGHDWQLQATDSLPSANWQEVGAPVRGEDKLTLIEIPRAPGARKFFRAIGSPVAP